MPRSAWTALASASITSAMVSPSCSKPAAPGLIAAAPDRATAMYSPSRWHVNSHQPEARWCFEPVGRLGPAQPVKSMVASSVARVTAVSVFPKPETFQTSPCEGSLLAPPGPLHCAPVNCTWENFGSEEIGSPKSGAAMIHSAVLPVNAAPGGRHQHDREMEALGLVDEGDDAEPAGELVQVVVDPAGGAVPRAGTVGVVQLMHMSRRIDVVHVLLVAEVGHVPV